MSDSQPLSAPRERLSVQIDADVKRIAKAQAAMRGLSVQYVVERLLSDWVAGRITLNHNS